MVICMVSILAIRHRSRLDIDVAIGTSLAMHGTNRVETNNGPIMASVIAVSLVRDAKEILVLTLPPNVVPYGAMKWRFLKVIVVDRVSWRVSRKLSSLP